MSSFLISLSGWPFACGNRKSSPFSSSGVVITKMMSSTNARSSSGVILISLSVTSELRCEKRRIVIKSLRRPNCSKYPSILLEIFRLHFRHKLLREVIQFDRQHAQVMHEPVVAEHR